MQFTLRPAQAADWPAIEALLHGAALPVAGAREHLDQFVVAEAGRIVGCAGLEPHGEAVLLRSLAVEASDRGRGLGQALTRHLLARAMEEGRQSVWLRTTTAADFFGLLGFLVAAPETVPEALRTSAAFQGACPDGAATLLLDLRPGVTVRPARADDMAAVLDIYNHEVRTSTATYQYAERTPQEQLEQWAAKQRDGHGFFVAETAAGEVVGYACYGLFRPREGWRFACEHSVYLHAQWRSRGIARMLMAPVMAHARRRGFHTMVGVIDASNAASVRMHEAMGFRVAGVLREGGYKFGRWLDVAFVQAML
ncbi:arsenic resistance N-acetyltransferase ArsN2 [Caldimonas thermodepolymerans]|uniref:L-amino acid N-acyltransferase YncA n=1 Tax=Caldimonas thermodepolymerans TaxID=215580 RepID=A0AA46DG80_9BURK|nr:arsenic resistance N-acetyltransferase ArsN2 [Caldimonas thermodepolymerans]TCP08643.1 L-amino acid N-acyltransferase YncA [Caldimonas thermodepolymerans]UZG46971.1 arsenic resistance N-acetyltransferase ArsN2 [Caldimonas thermodepolymerans]